MVAISKPPPSFGIFRLKVLEAAIGGWNARTQSKSTSFLSHGGFENGWFSWFSWSCAESDSPPGCNKYQKMRSCMPSAWCINGLNSFARFLLYGHFGRRFGQLEKFAQPLLLALVCFIFVPPCNESAHKHVCFSCWHVCSKEQVGIANSIRLSKGASNRSSKEHVTIALPERSVTTCDNRMTRMCGMEPWCSSDKDCSEARRQGRQGTPAKSASFLIFDMPNPTALDELLLSAGHAKLCRLCGGASVQCKDRNTSLKTHRVGEWLQELGSEEEAWQQSHRRMIATFVLSISSVVFVFSCFSFNCVNTYSILFNHIYIYIIYIYIMLSTD